MGCRVRESPFVWDLGFKFRIRVSDFFHGECLAWKGRKLKMGLKL